MSVRSSAVVALSKIATPEAQKAVEEYISALIQALSDEDEVVRANAAEALGEIGEPAVPALIQALSDEDEVVRASAVVVLGEIGEPAKEIVPALIQALSDESMSVRASAVLMLGQIATPEAQKAVEEYEQRK